MKLLSIETSCDDTCISIFEVKSSIQNAEFKVLANSSNSQIKIHQPFGGVYPVLAKREHNTNLPILLEEAMREARISGERRSSQRDGVRKAIPQQRNMRAESARNPGLDLIAVTYGPGLEMCLWEGVVFAKNLAEKWKVPLIPVNHMEGHILSVFGKDKGKFKIPKINSAKGGVKTPMLSLLVSGGHTQLVLTKKWMQYEIIGETLDDAVGEAFDKVARMLELPYPGGPEISRLAEGARSFSKRRSSQRDGARKAIRPQANMRAESAETSGLRLPRPMLHSKDFNFSFSGLKTAVLYLIRDLVKKDPNILQNDKMKMQIALEFENAAIECLVYKTKKAIEKHKIKTLIVAGGVAANRHLKNKMQKIKNIEIFFPTKELATDNSLMIGIAGYLNYIKNKKKVPKPESIKATGNLRL